MRIMKFNQIKLPYLQTTTNLLIKLRTLGGLVALESSEADHENGRWSIISAAPAETFTVEAEVLQADIHSELEKLHDALPQIKSNLPFTGGVIGHIAYDLGIPNDFSPALHCEKQELLTAGLYTWAFLLDHTQQNCTLIYWDKISSIPQEKLIEIYKSPDESAKHFSITSQFVPNWTKNQYKNKFDRIQNYITAGDTYQVNLAQRFSTQFSGDPLIAYAKLKNRAQVPFACYFEGANFQFCSASPELFISANDLNASTKPIKGTRSRGVNTSDDESQKKLLKESKKDQAENLMIVDLLRNDLSKHSSKVTVSKLFSVESFSTVHHLVSTINSTLNHPNDILKLFLSALPGGSITGAPKKRSMEIIQELEDQARSFYCGSSFYWSSNQRFSSNILIRSFLFEDGNVYCWGGGGIVADSKWEDEYQESLDKVSRLMESLSE